MKQTITTLRGRIRDKDSEIVRLLNERAGLARSIGKLKIAEGSDIHDPAQERRVLQAVSGINEGPMPGESIRRIYRAIISESCALQEKDSPKKSSGRVKRKLNLCIPVPGRTAAEALEWMRKLQGRADLLELRLDRMPGTDIRKLLSARPLPVIVTNRARAEGGSFRGSEETRIGILKEAVAGGADYVDVELRSGNRAVAGIREEIGRFGNRTRLIVSSHDFKGTPEPKILRRTLRACLAGEGAIAKVVTFARRPEDCLRVLELIPLGRGMGREVIAFCMGEKGKASRINAALLGSCVNYASAERNLESAPGQLSAGEMAEMLEVLK